MHKSKVGRKLVFSSVLLRSVGTALQFVMQAVVSLFYNTDGLGRYNVFISNVLFVGSILSVGAHQYIFYNPNHESRNVIVARYLAYMKFAIPWFLFALLFLFLIGKLEYLENSVVFFVLAIWGWAATKLSAEVLRALYMPNKANLVEFISPPIIMVAAVLAARKWSVMSDVVIVYVFALILSLLLGVLVVSYVVKYRLAGVEVVKVGVIDTLKKTLRKRNLFNWLSYLGGQSHAVAPYLVLPIIATPSDIGLFAIAHRVMGGVSTINLALAGVFVPKISCSGGGDEIIKSAKLYAFFMVFSAVVFIWFVRGYLFDIFSIDSASDRIIAEQMLAILLCARLVVSFFGLIEHVFVVFGFSHLDTIYLWCTFILMIVLVKTKIIDNVVEFAVMFALIHVSRALMMQVVLWRAKKRS